MRFFSLVLMLSPFLAAHEWDGQEYAKNSESQRLAAEQLLCQHAFTGSEKVLDIGCGDGKITAAISERVPKGSCHGVDLSEEMLECARACHKRDNLSFSQGDAAHLDVSSDHDLVVSFSALMWVKDQQSALNGVSHALKPSGKALISIVAGYPAPLSESLQELTSSPKYASYFEGFTLPVYFWTPSEYAAMVENAGMNVRYLRYFGKGDHFPTVEALSGFIRQWLPQLKRVPTDQHPQFMNDLMKLYMQKVEPLANGKVLFDPPWMEVVAQKT